MTQRSMTQAQTPGQRAGQGAGTRRPPGRTVTLTGRGAAVALFAACFLGLLIAAWTGWSALADVVFVMACGVVACHTRVSGLRGLVACPPLAFFTGSVLAQLLTAPNGFVAAEEILITLGASAPWLFTGTALTAAIALGRGWRPERAALGVFSNLREALRDIRTRAGRRIRRR